MTRHTARHQAKWEPVRRPDGAPSQTSARQRRAVALLGATIVAASLAGCGKVGQLDRPGPLFGKAKAEGQAAPKQDPTRPVETVDPRDRSTDNAPPRTLPIPGTSPGATGVAPPGVLPDPYANPR